MIVGSRRAISDGRGGRRDEQPEHEQRADGTERRDDGEREQGEHGGVRQSGPQAERGRLVPPARQGEEGPVADHDADERRQQHDGLEPQLAVAHGEDVAEEERREVAGVRVLAD